MHLPLANTRDGIENVLITVTFIAIVVVPFLIVRARRRSLANAAKDRSASQTPGMVRFVFHKYSGFFVVMRQSTYDTVLPIADAEALLKKFVLHNMTWGLIGCGAVFVPILTLVDWLAQKKRIAAARPGFPVSAH
jgi:hypothetical protein